MARRAVDDGRVGYVFAVMDEDGPDLDKDKEREVGELLKREEEREQVVGQRLREAVDRMERHGGIRSRHNPFVVRLVKVLVDAWMMQSSMNKVDAKVGKEEEEWKLCVIVPSSGPIGSGVVQLGIAAYLGDEKGRRQDSNPWHSRNGLVDFLPDLILEKLWVLKSGFVKDKEVGEGGDEEVDGGADKPGSKESTTLSFKQGYQDPPGN